MRELLSSSRIFKNRVLGWRTLVPTALACLLAGILYVVTAAPTITQRFGGVDGGELAAVALSGGVTHPPGYPTYLLLARAALLLPLREPAGRLALLSAVCAALAVACTTTLVVKAASSAPGTAPAPAASFAGFYAGLVLALGERFWSQAIIAEVYAAHLLALALCTLLLWVWLDGGQPWALPVATLFTGLGLGIHLTLLALVPAGVIAFILAPRRPHLTLRLILTSSAALCAGLSVYALLPLWAASRPVVSWGDLDGLTGLWVHVSGTEYRYLVGIVPWRQRIERLGFAVRDLLVQPGPVAVVLALWWGLPYAWDARRSLTTLTAGVALINLLFAVGYGAADGTVYLLPWTWVWSIWAGIGVYALTRTLASARALRPSLPLIGLRAVLAASLLWPLLTQYGRLNLHADSSERARAVRQLIPLPRAAVLLTDDDAETFGAWYAQRALNVRQDVVVVDVRLLAWPWYRSQLRRVLRLPDDTDLCAHLITHEEGIVQAGAPTTNIRDLHAFCRAAR